MLARYQIVRGKRPPQNPLPEGRRLDTRKHTRHCLRPEKAQVEAFIRDPSNAGFARFERDYRATLERRFTQDRRPFDELAALAATEAVFLGCNCPTSFNPDVTHCHTALALAFMQRKYPKLSVVMPQRSATKTQRSDAKTRRSATKTQRSGAKTRRSAT
jgi:hypothetical protein